ncbi:MAG: hypothetical protein M0C28_43525 [Candidatus Moduliflexus flocculans]|nr:hypothetical protein [Candidatus Moduliflexus flocculans]
MFRGRGTRPWCWPSLGGPRNPVRPARGAGRFPAAPHPVLRIRGDRGGRPVRILLRHALAPAPVVRLPRGRIRQRSVAGAVRTVYDILGITIKFGLVVLGTGLLINWINLARKRRWLT